jgi:NADH dehydrogenase
MPSWERKWRVIFGWLGNFFLGRDFASLAATLQPRAAFEEFASRPKPPAPVEEPKVEAPAPAGPVTPTEEQAPAEVSEKADEAVADAKAADAKAAK